KYPHHDIFHASRCGDGRHPQLDIEGTELLELDFAVLGLSALGYVDVAHDLQPRRNRIAIASGHRNVVRELSILAEPDLGLRLARIGLDVYVGSALLIRIDDDFIDELD